MAIAREAIEKKTSKRKDQQVPTRRQQMQQESQVEWLGSLTFKRGCCHWQLEPCIVSSPFQHREDAGAQIVDVSNAGHGSFAQCCLIK